MRSPSPWGWATINGKPFREHRLMSGDTDVGNNVAIGYYERGHVTDEEHEDNKEFIVRACNAHDALVKTLRAVEWACRNGAGMLSCPACFATRTEGHNPRACQLSAALELANGSDHD